MRTIIAGSRSAERYEDLLEAVSLFEAAHGRPTLILSGTARGADQLGERWARDNSIPVERYPAKWDIYGKRAGYLRNAEMAEKAEALIALWDGVSPGTGHMIRLAEKSGLKIVVQPLKNYVGGTK